MKVLDIMLNKGKGPVLSKLRIIQNIEADLKLIMRVFWTNETKRKLNMTRDYQSLIIAQGKDIVLTKLF